MTYFPAFGQSTDHLAIFSEDTGSLLKTQKLPPSPKAARS